MIIENQTFWDSDAAINLTEGDDIDYVLVHHCTFINCKRVVAGWINGPKIRHFVFQNNIVIGCTEFGVLLANPFRAAVVSNNTFLGCGRTAIQLGWKVDEPELPGDQWQHGSVDGNTIWLTESAAEVHAVICYGRNHVVSRNLIGYVYATQPKKSAEGVYFQTIDAVAIQNICVNAGGKEGQIVSKHTKSTGTVLHENTIIHTEGRDPAHDRAVLFNNGGYNTFTGNTLIGDCRQEMSDSSRPTLEAGNETFRNRMPKGA